MIADEIRALAAQLEHADIIDRAVTDAAQVKPAQGRVTALIGPPSIQWEQWDEHATSFDVWLIAGTMGSQADALDSIYTAIDQLETLQEANLIQAEPAGFKRPNGDTLAAYKLQINREE
ncbi:hypothetical protein BLEM_0604 [Bifidobacterium lemurum]|uniref:Uncharacterized protein n=1 Tax=Bifidobacterium lemurum TaxID=1603886 RepID=A0A261FU37_9BIFI|nr:hypothetical protein [Bifidobacterium lemurum]OZG62687.1 hypothetical protein BLEM_0604 [Bifidobacterium lemurum]QOL34596.1 hypothetical protein BL8807_01280 [Bifidobacterium lemurum]